MIQRVILLFLLIGLSSFSLRAQKIKYKDLIILLTARDFEKAEPFLKRYLKENNENPNAFLYMAIIYQDKAGRIDPLTHTNILTSTIDSSLVFFDKAYKTIDERELKKNDEYYEAYTRRDLRTGKFVIKLSDVRLDIESRTKALQERKGYVKELRSYLTESSDAYTRASKIYKSLLEKYGSEREFFLRSDVEMTATLKSLAIVFDTVNFSFEKYKSVSKAIGKTGYNQVIDLQEIKDLKRDGSGTTDFLKDDLKLWDYKRWANASIEIIEKEIIPMRDNLVAYDVEINKLRSKLKTDSVSVKSDLSKLVTKMLSDQLRKYDPEPMPLAVLAMNMAELEYASNMVVNKPLRDSTSVSLRLKAITNEIKDLKRIDSLATNLSKRDFVGEEKDYKDFITRAYGTANVLKSLISTTEDFAKRERLKRETEWERVSQSLKWLITGSDSIPLFTESNRELRFKPIAIEQEKYTYGLVFQDSLATGYFYDITPSRIPEIKVNFQVDQPSFKKRSLPLTKGLSTTDGNGHIYFALVYSTQKVAEKFPATLAKIYRSDGLAWSSNFTFEMLPSELSYSESGELSIKMTGADGANKIVKVDKNGKLIP